MGIRTRLLAVAVRVVTAEQRIASVPMDDPFVVADGFTGRSVSNVLAIVR